MPPPRSDRTLRRLVAELAAASDEDVEAVVAELSPLHRRRITALLASFVGEPEPIAPTAHAPDLSTPKLVGLSPWLEARLDDGANGKVGQFDLTPASRAALREAIENIDPAPMAFEFSRPTARPRGFRQILDRLTKLQARV